MIPRHCKFEKHWSKVPKLAHDQLCKRAPDSRLIALLPDSRRLLAAVTVKKVGSGRDKWRSAKSKVLFLTLPAI